MTRLALYFAPPSDSPWWQAGCAWLGRDPESGLPLPAPCPELIQEPRRYGWHGTLVAPFACAQGVSHEDVLAAARNWALDVQPFELPLQAVQMGSFVALRAARPEDDARLREVAAGALDALASLRRRASAEANARRTKPGMSARQIALLHTWDYPYVLEEFRFHMTVSDSLANAADRERIEDRWGEHVRQLGPIPFHGAALFVEPEPGGPFSLWQRIPFSKPKNREQ